MLAPRAITAPIQPTRAALTAAAAAAVLALPSTHAAAQEIDRPATLPPDEQALLGGGRLADRLEGQALADTLERAAAADQDVVHVVEPGEHLSAIAAAYGIEGEDGWRRLFDANPAIDDPNLLEPGDEVRIPRPDEEFEPRPLPAAVTAPAGAATAASAGVTTTGVWDRLARCESGGNWQINTGNGYYGGLQFSLSSWQAVGGSGYPHEHSRATQIALAQRLLARQGWGAWPACSAKLGLR